MQKEPKSIIISKLRERGCRITRQRRIILDIILDEDCSCCKEIYYKACKQDSSIGAATVYRMVNTLEEIGVIEGEIQRLLPDEHIYRNLNQIVCIHEIKPGETQAGFREEMEKLYQTVQKQIFHRNKTTDFQIGIGSIVNGYGDLKKSFKDSKKIIDYMDMLRYLYGDKNISVADFSKLGFFQIFEKIKNRDELMEYVPESLV